MPFKNIDHDKNIEPLAAIDSGQDDSLVSNRTPPLSHKAPTAEGWVALCARAAVEQDPKKLLELVSEINRLLDARRKRLANETSLTGGIHEASEPGSPR